jgi:hypothetical protein
LETIKIIGKKTIFSRSLRRFRTENWKNSQKTEKHGQNGQTAAKTTSRNTNNWTEGPKNHNNSNFETFFATEHGHIGTENFENRKTTRIITTTAI